MGYRTWIIAGVASAVAAGACGGGSSNTDGMRDADVPPDASCDGDIFFTAELVDFEAMTPTSVGVGGATLQIAGEPAIVTPPSGRFDVCATGGPTVLLSVDNPGDRFDGVAYIEARGPSLRTPRLRSLTRSRADAFYQLHGLDFDLTKAHVLVFVAGDLAELTLDRPHGTVVAGDEPPAGSLAWDVGNVGRYVLFPNVDAATPMATLTGDVEGPHTFPIAAGTFTWVSVSWVFL